MLMRVYEIWQYAGKVYGNERNHLPPTQSIRGFQYAFEFRGKSAHFTIVTHDSSLSRDIALEFATSIANEQFKRLSIDFAEHNKQVQNYVASYVRKGRK